jgi:hypothetical protein
MITQALESPIKANNNVDARFRIGVAEPARSCRSPIQEALEMEARPLDVLSFPTCDAAASARWWPSGGFSL